MSFGITDWGSDDIIDSRDIIERYEELQAEFDVLTEAQQDARDAWGDHTRGSQEEMELDEVDEHEELARDLQEHHRIAAKAVDEWLKENGAELNALREICREGETFSDWVHGETLIHEDYFTKYIAELIHDCYEMPKEMTSGDWPWRHITIDYEAAAKEALSDYFEITYDGTTYYIRG